MFIRQYFKHENGQLPASWAIVESYRAANEPRQRVVAWLGKLDEAGRLEKLRAAENTKQSAVQNDQHDGRQQPHNQQLQFEFDDAPALEPRWGEVNAAGVRIENLRQFGGPWMALHLSRVVICDEQYRRWRCSRPEFPNALFDGLEDAERFDWRSQFRKNN